MLKFVTVVAIVGWIVAEPNSCEQPDGRPVITFEGETGDAIYAAVRGCGGSEENTVKLMKLIGAGKWRDDDEFKKFVSCGYLKAGFASELDGSVYIEAAAKLFPEPEEMLSIMKECDKLRGDTPTDTTFEFFKCFQINSPYLIGFV